MRSLTSAAAKFILDLQHADTPDKVRSAITRMIERLQQALSEMQ